MSSPQTPRADIVHGANEALRLARRSFLKGLRFNAQVMDSLPTGVSFNQKTKKSFLSINPSDPLATSLFQVVGSWQDAWLLILAHESGHIRLNSICHANGDNPDDPNAQLKAIGIQISSYDSFTIAEFQKETAIESFCDVCLGKTALDTLGNKWRAAIQALSDYRKNARKNLGFFDGDEYATQPALDKLLESEGKIEPGTAARFAFEESLSKTSGLKKAAVATASALPKLKNNLRDRLKQWRASSTDEKEAPPPPAP